jgi:hypothetical protein
MCESQKDSSSVEPKTELTVQDPANINMDCSWIPDIILLLVQPFPWGGGGKTDGFSSIR